MKVISPLDTSNCFPPLETALDSPNGLLAIGGNLSLQRLLSAYGQGIFPWYSQGDPIMWWSPDPRLVLFPRHLKISRSLKKTLRRQEFQIRFDFDFPSIIRACAEPREDQAGTWITPEMQDAYIQLHHAGYAHSIEAWQDNQLAGGLYGVAIGQVFFGESMFTRRSNASKAAFCELVIQLQDWNYQLIDCQVRTEHLVSLGAQEIPRHHFSQLLKKWTEKAPSEHAWQSTGQLPGRPCSEEPTT